MRITLHPSPRYPGYNECADAFLLLPSGPGLDDALTEVGYSLFLQEECRLDVMYTSRLVVESATSAQEAACE